MDNLEKIYREVATELGLRHVLVRNVAESQFAFVAKTFREKNFNDVRLQFWGIFKIKPMRLKYLADKTKEQIKQKTHEFDKIL